MKPMRCILVDDERLARNNLRALLKAHPELVVAGEAASVQQAEEAIRRLKPDLVFLDIQLPDADGFALLERLEEVPRIIFVTAFDRYAVRAFEVNALDYLLKPVDPERLRLTLERLEPGEKSAGPPAEAVRLLREDSVLIPAGRSGYFVRVEDILLITVDGNYTTVTTRDGRAHIVLNTLAEWEKRLPVDGFLRVGCAELINLREIQKIAPCGRSMLVELGSARLQVRLNRAASARLKQVMDRAFPPLL